ncbi:ArnT family glycosyltransferase [Desulfolithobacter dissulfuricans]|nr:glycosyltransferase family 39 protein [Desulfolithobacter dissulfuricans]
MKPCRELWLPCLILLLPGLLFILCMPPMPIDETRYLAVAWEMHLNNSYIVPHLNGLPYSHKPPLLFWLINLDWWLFGVNERTLRAIPLLFSLLNILLIYRIGLQLWRDSRTARYAAIITASCLLYLIWSSLIMFDIVLTFWVLLGIYGLLKAGQAKNMKPWLLVGLGLGGGLLTKGPVILVHVLPVALLGFLWLPRSVQIKRWYGGLLLALGIGLGLVSLWLIPAVMTGGEGYRQDILWGQTVNRVVSSFAHRHPWWWYLPLVPVLLLPWILLRPVWSGFAMVRKDPGRCFPTVWALSSLAVLSLISGKQIYYLVPLIPAFSLLLARNITTFPADTSSSRWYYPPATLYILLGILVYLLRYLPLEGSSADILLFRTGLLALGLITTGLVFLVLRNREIEPLVTWTGLSSAALICLLLVSGDRFFQRYDIRDVARILKAREEQGYTLINKGKYYGQFQFTGRLTRPVLVAHRINDLRNYVENHEKSLLITYEPVDRAINQDEIFFQQLYRGKKLVLWNEQGMKKYLSR